MKTIGRLLGVCPISYRVYLIAILEQLIQTVVLGAWSCLCEHVPWWLMALKHLRYYLARIRIPVGEEWFAAEVTLWEKLLILVMEFILRSNGHLWRFKILRILCSLGLFRHQQALLLPFTLPGLLERRLLSPSMINSQVCPPRITSGFRISFLDSYLLLHHDGLCSKDIAIIEVITHSSS